MATLHGTLEFCKARLQALEICWASSPEVDVLGPVFIEIKQAAVFTVEWMGTTASTRASTNKIRSGISHLALPARALRFQVHT